MASRGRGGGGRGGGRGGGGGGGGGSFAKRGSDSLLGGDGKRSAAGIGPDPNSPVQMLFADFQTQLDAANDRRERLVKTSRDITIASKRLIFLLHRLSSGSDPAALWAQVEAELLPIHELFAAIARELVGHEYWQYQRAFSPGLQEYIEALSFYHALRYGELITRRAVMDVINAPPPAATAAGQAEGQQPAGPGGAADLPIADQPMAPPPPVFHVSEADYLLGIADLTGELMRLAINSVASGERELCATVAAFLRRVHDGFLSLPLGPGRAAGPLAELSKKIAVMKQSLQKVETACAQVIIRCSEFPDDKEMLQRMLSNLDTEPGPDDDDAAA